MEEQIQKTFEKKKKDEKEKVRKKIERKMFVI
jgi:hypothetical protein